MITNPYLNSMQMYQPYQTYQPVQQAQPQTIQNSGFVSVMNEMEARNYPVAPGNSITFKDENQPFVYVKTMGFSQLDRPVFERFRLVKEEATPQPQTAPANGISQPMANDIASALKADVDALRTAYGDISAEVARLKNLIEIETEADSV